MSLIRVKPDAVPSPWPVHQQVMPDRGVASPGPHCYFAYKGGVDSVNTVIVECDVLGVKDAEGKAVKGTECIQLLCPKCGGGLLIQPQNKKFKLDFATWIYDDDGSRLSPVLTVDEPIGCDYALAETDNSPGEIGMCNWRVRITDGVAVDAPKPRRLKI